MKIRNLLFSFGLLILVGCGEEFFPEGLYGYQVERLLASDSSKIWELTSLEVNGKQQDLTISDEWGLLLIGKVELGSNPATDSIRVMTIDGSDTLLIGGAKASYYELIFTDSLLFDSGDYWIIQSVTSEKFKFSQYPSGDKVTYSYRLMD